MSRAEKKAARERGLTNEFLEAFGKLTQQHPNGVTLSQIGGRMEAEPVFDGFEGGPETYLGRRGVGKLLMLAGVKVGLVHAVDMIAPIRDRLVESGQIETAEEAPALQQDGHPQYMLHRPVFAAAQ